MTFTPGVWLVLWAVTIVTWLSPPWLPWQVCVVRQVLWTVTIVTWLSPPWLLCQVCVVWQVLWEVTIVTQVLPPWPHCQVCVVWQVLWEVTIVTQVWPPCQVCAMWQVLWEVTIITQVLPPWPPCQVCIVQNLIPDSWWFMHYSCMIHGGLCTTVAWFMVVYALQLHDSWWFVHYSSRDSWLLFLPYRHGTSSHVHPYAVQHLPSPSHSGTCARRSPGGDLFRQAQWDLHLPGSHPQVSWPPLSLSLLFNTLGSTSTWLASSGDLGTPLPLPTLQHSRIYICLARILRWVGHPSPSPCCSSHMVTQLLRCQRWSKWNVWLRDACYSCICGGGGGGGGNECKHCGSNVKGRIEKQNLQVSNVYFINFFTILTGYRMEQSNVLIVNVYFSLFFPFSNVYFILFFLFSTAGCYYYMKTCWALHPEISPLHFTVAAMFSVQSVCDIYFGAKVFFLMLLCLPFRPFWDTPVTAELQCQTPQGPTVFVRLKRLMFVC